MGKLTFYVLWSVRDAPRQFISKSNRRRFQVHIPLPLPEHLVIFGLGEWKSGEAAAISVDVVVGAGVPTQTIGTLSAESRCLTWEGVWNADVATVAAERGRRGVYGKIVLTVCEEVESFHLLLKRWLDVCSLFNEEKASVISSTPLALGRGLLFPEADITAELSCTLHQSTGNEMITAIDSSHPGDSVCSAEIQVNKIDASDSTVGSAAPVWPTDETPRRTVISKRGHLNWSGEDADSLVDNASTPKKKKLSRMNSVERMTVQIKAENREARPSKRWSHSMCLSDPDTAILIGGETADQNYCSDSLWKLELDNDFWFPMNFSASGPVPPCARGHTATFDPDSKSIFVYGGLRDGRCHSDLYVLNTLTWKWRPVAARGKVPSLAYHSAAFYKKELFVFGGVQPSCPSGVKSCSNALYIFNLEFELWYQPIVEGERPLPRFGHSATLMSQRLIIFGGRTTATYLNDVHVLDLGFMEYTAVKCGNMPSLPRGFHAALPVSDNKILVSGGCSAIGPLQDVHIFNIDTNTWSSVASSPLCSKPRAGHSVINLGGEPGEAVGVSRTLLLFGGSDCCGSFYDDTVKCTIEVPGDK